MKPAHSVHALHDTLSAHFEIAPRPGYAPRVAVLLPCHNEAASIAAVITAFRAALPEAMIYVYDNASSDATATLARHAGAEVRVERRRGKGHVVRRMFADIEADVYLMADGDGTYHAPGARTLIDLVVVEGNDMAVGARENIVKDAHRAGHAAGNRLFNSLYGRFFGAEFGDIFSGYRAFSRRFVKSFPALSAGFEIETEISVHATQLMLPTAEVVLPYGKRQAGSTSKLKTFRDGWRILRAFLYLLKETRPFVFFGTPAVLGGVLATVLAVPLVATFLKTGMVPRMPTAVLCTGLMLLASIFGVCGLVLDSLARSRAEQKRILFLAVANR